MPHPQRTSGKIELTHNLTTETQSRHRMNGTEEQRMMANQQINTTGNRLINHRHRGISRKSDTAHRLTQITHDKTRLIPLLRIAKRIQRFQHIHNLLQRCHHSSLCHCSTTHIRNTHETQYRISARQAANPNQYPWKHPTEPPYRRMLHGILHQRSDTLRLTRRNLHHKFIMNLQNNPTGKTSLMQRIISTNHSDLHNIRSRTLNRRIQRGTLRSITHRTIRRLQARKIPTTTINRLRISLFTSRRNQRLQILMDLAERRKILPLQ